AISATGFGLPDISCAMLCSYRRRCVEICNRAGIVNLEKLVGLQSARGAENVAAAILDPGGRGSIRVERLQDTRVRVAFFHRVGLELHTGRDAFPLIDSFTKSVYVFLGNALEGVFGN